MRDGSLIGPVGSSFAAGNRSGRRRLRTLCAASTMCFHQDANLLAPFVTAIGFCSCSLACTRLGTRCQFAARMLIPKASEQDNRSMLWRCLAFWANRVDTAEIEVPSHALKTQLQMSISRAGRRCSSRYSIYGVSTPSIHFMKARTRRDRLLRCATTRDTASARRRKSGMISTSAPLSKYRPIPKSGA